MVFKSLARYIPARVLHRADQHLMTCSPSLQAWLSFLLLCRAADAGRKTAAELQEQLQEAKQKLSDTIADRWYLTVWLATF